MDQIKIGKFIAACRKNNNLTQMQLAEKFNITDRAVSKWENGKALPDASIMLDLCGELKISVNELLSGEKIEVTMRDEKTEKILLEMARREQMNNKKLFAAMYVIIVLSVVALVSVITLAENFIADVKLKNAVCIVAVVLGLMPMFFAFKLEVDAGYYECKKCRHKFVPTYAEALMAFHIGTTRFLKCPKCNKRYWCKKVLINYQQ